MFLSLVFFQGRRWCGLLSRRLLFCWRMELPIGDQLLLPLTGFLIPPMGLYFYYTAIRSRTPLHSFDLSADFRQAH